MIERRSAMSARSTLTASILSTLAMSALTLPAMAQQSGGLQIHYARPGGPVGLARPLLSAPMPLITAQQMQGGMTASDHQTVDQNLISALQGDPGFLSGFQFGMPMAASSQMQMLPSQLSSQNSQYRHQPVQRLPDDFGYRYRRQQGQAMPNGGSTRYRQYQAEAASGGGARGYSHQHGGRNNAPVIINNDGSLAFTSGNNNVVQLSSVLGASGPVAQQQVANMPGAIGGSAVNLAGSARR